MILLKHLDSDTGGTEICDLIARKETYSAMDYMVAFHNIGMEEKKVRRLDYPLPSDPGWNEMKDNGFLLIWNSRMGEVYFLRENKTKQNKAMNKELLLKVKEQILKEPLQFQMSSFFSVILDQTKIQQDESNDNNYLFDRPSNCGTACCIAGWAITLGREFKSPKEAWSFNPTDENGRYLDNDEDALKLLKIDTYFKYKWLFYVVSWPLDFADRWYYANSHEEQAQIAAEVIDYFIKQYEQEQQTSNESKTKIQETSTENIN